MSLFFDNYYRTRSHQFGEGFGYFTNPIINSVIDMYANTPIGGYYVKYQTWTVSGTFHNDNAPAIINPNGEHEWYKKGKRFSIEKEKLLNIWWNKNHTFESIDF